MTEETKSQPKYTPPRVMRLGEVRAGAGLCLAPGSGDATDCAAGNNAGDWCLAPGSTAATSCDTPGNSAITDCWGAGNAATGAGCTPTGSGPV